MRKTLFAAISIVLMLFAFVACQSDPTTIPSEQEAANNLAEDFLSSMDFIGVLGDALKGDSEELAVVGTPTTESVTVEFSNYAVSGLDGGITAIKSGQLSYTFKDSAAKALSDKVVTISTSKDAPIVFSLKDGTEYEGGSMAFSLNGTATMELVTEDSAVTLASGSKITSLEIAEDITIGDLTVTADDITITPDEDPYEPPAVEPAWDITVAVAKHSEAEPFDGYVENSPYVTATIDGDVITINAEVSQMESFVSSDETQDDEAHKWFAILIGTGEPDITKVSYEGSPLEDDDIADRDDMLHTDGSKAASDEFVLWLKAEDCKESFTLSREGLEDRMITIKFNSIMGNEDYATVLEDIKSFGHDRVLTDIKSLFEEGQNFDPERDGSLTLNKDSIKYDGSKLSFTATATDYCFCGKANDITATGTVEFTFGGKANSKGFEASRYSVDSDNFTIGEHEYTFTGVGGLIVEEKIGVDVTEPEAKVLTITIGEDGKPTTMDFLAKSDMDDIEPGATHGSHALWIPDKGEMTLNGASGTVGDFVAYAEENLSELF